MQTKTLETTQATACPAMARSQNHQKEAYAKQDRQSRPKSMEQIGDVLCLLTLFPLSATARAGFAHLFRRRIERAYAGGCA